jgi:hypothetical protein
MGIGDWGIGPNPKKIKNILKIVLLKNYLINYKEIIIYHLSV